MAKLFSGDVPASLFTMNGIQYPTKWNEFEIPTPSEESVPYTNFWILNYRYPGQNPNYYDPLVYPVERSFLWGRTVEEAMRWMEDAYSLHQMSSEKDGAFVPWKFPDGTVLENPEYGGDKLNGWDITHPEFWYPFVYNHLILAGLGPFSEEEVDYLEFQLLGVNFPFYKYNKEEEVPEWMVLHPHYGNNYPPSDEIGFYSTPPLADFARHFVFSYEMIESLEEWSWSSLQFSYNPETEVPAGKSWNLTGTNPDRGSSIFCERSRLEDPSSTSFAISAIKFPWQYSDMEYQRNINNSYYSLPHNPKTKSLRQVLCWYCNNRNPIIAFHSASKTVDIPTGAETSSISGTAKIGLYWWDSKAYTSDNGFDSQQFIQPITPSLGNPLLYEDILNGTDWFATLETGDNFLELPNSIMDSEAPNPECTPHLIISFDLEEEVPLGKKEIFYLDAHQTTPEYLPTKMSREISYPCYTSLPFAGVSKRKIFMRLGVDKLLWKYSPGRLNR